MRRAKKAKSVAYPRSSDVGVYEWRRDFSFPPEFVRELKDKFPDWPDLHKALKANNQGGMWGLLWEYGRRMARVKSSDVLEAVKTGKIDQLAERMRDAIRLKKYFADLEKRYFPENIRARAEARRAALASWE